MVQRMGSLHFEEVEDFSEEEYGSFAKRSRLTASPVNQWSPQNHEFPIPASLYNPLDEPSPLGLRLRKSPSLLDLIQMRLSQGNTASVAAAPSEIVNFGSNKVVKQIAASGAGAGANDKLKASNFRASLLRIGSWELARKPVFFRETSPQPRKHTLWQATSDFTDGQASIYRQHYIQCPPGVLSKHYEKLIQCDMRLSNLSKQPEIAMDSPYFESQDSVLENSEESKDDGCNQMPTAAKGSPSSVFEDAASAATPPLYSSNFGPSALAAKQVSKEAPSPSSVMDAHAIEGDKIINEHDSEGQKSWEPLKVPGLHPSLSMSDLVNHVGNFLSEQMTSGSLPSDKSSEHQDLLENVAQVLLSDAQYATGLDEKSLMKKVNSLCCLLQDPVVASSAQVDGEKCYEGVDHGKNISFDLMHDSTHEKAGNIMQASEENIYDGPGCNQAPAMPRKDSLGDLLLHLPHIASLPKFLFGIAEDDEYQAI